MCVFCFEHCLFVESRTWVGSNSIGPSSLTGEEGKEKSHSLRLKKEKTTTTRRALKIPRKKDFFSSVNRPPRYREGEIEVSAENPANKWCFSSFNSKVVSLAVNLPLFAQYSQVQVFVVLFSFSPSSFFPFFFEYELTCAPIRNRGKRRQQSMEVTKYFSELVRQI